jgi:hypothetical protein
VICALDGNDHVTALAGDDLVLGGKVTMSSRVRTGRTC